MTHFLFPIVEAEKRFNKHFYACKLRVWSCSKLDSWDCGRNGSL